MTTSLRALTRCLGLTGPVSVSRDIVDRAERNHGGRRGLGRLTGPVSLARVMRHLDWQWCGGAPYLKAAVPPELRSPSGEEAQIAVEGIAERITLFMGKSDWELDWHLYPRLDPATTARVAEAGRLRSGRLFCEWMAVDRWKREILGRQWWSSDQGLQTPSGKIEFVSKTLKNLEMDVVDPERPAMGPQFIASWEGHHTSELYGKYPLQMVSPHPRFSFHTMGDSKGTWLNEVEEHRILHDDGHRYWIMRLNSVDAEARGIAEGDLIRAFNDRGSVLLCAQLTERVAPGTVHSYESCAEYLPQGEPGESTDIAGCVNILTNKRFITPTSLAMSNNSCLIEVEKWEGEAS